MSVLEVIPHFSFGCLVSLFPLVSFLGVVCGIPPWQLGCNRVVYILSASVEPRLLLIFLAGLGGELDFYLGPLDLVGLMIGHNLHDCEGLKPDDHGQVGHLGVENSGYSEGVEEVVQGGIQDDALVALLAKETTPDDGY